MGVKAEGKYFRLVESEEELEEVMHYLEQFLPESIKVIRTVSHFSGSDIHFFLSFIKLSERT